MDCSIKHIKHAVRNPPDVRLNEGHRNYLWQQTYLQTKFPAKATEMSAVFI